MVCTTIGDLCFGFRNLVKNPRFALISTGSLALGIGASTAMFSVIYAVLLNPFPYKDVDHLASIVLEDPNGRGEVACVARPKYDFRVVSQAHRPKVRWLEASLKGLLLLRCVRIRDVTVVHDQERSKVSILRVPSGAGQGREHLLAGIRSGLGVGVIHTQTSTSWPPGHLSASAANSSWLVKVSVPSSLPWISLREAKTVMLFSAFIVNAVMMSFLTLARSKPVVDDIHGSTRGR